MLHCYLKRNERQDAIFIMYLITKIINKLNKQICFTFLGIRWLMSSKSSKSSLSCLGDGTVLDGESSLVEFESVDLVRPLLLVASSIHLFIYLFTINNDNSQKAYLRQVTVQCH